MQTTIKCVVVLAIAVMADVPLNSQQSFELDFPLRNLTPFSPNIINSVFDLSSDTGPNREDFIVRAYTGEEGREGFGASDNCYHKDITGTEFVLSGNYRGAAGSKRYLCYDGHHGVDYKVVGVDVLAVADGVVSELKGDAADEPDRQCGCYGNYIKLTHANGLISIYGHLRRNSLVRESTGAVLAVGDTVARGEQIAISGNSGASSGDHLHFELRRRSANGFIYVDPYSLWAPQHRFSFALESVRVDGNVNGSGPSDGVADFVDEFDDGFLTRFPTSEFFTSPVRESSGFLHLRTSDGASVTEEQERRVVFLSDSAALGSTSASPFILQNGFGSAVATTVFRADTPSPGQAYGVFISTTERRESVSLQVGNDGAGPRIAAVVFIEGEIFPQETVVPLPLAGTGTIALRLSLDDDRDTVSARYSIDGGRTFTVVPLSRVGRVFSGTGAAVVQVFGSVFVRTF